uniref:Cyclin-like domain-containing protein n=1 Tax=Chenopodium quinoa TaxID=63459 RepID=A0A803LNK1_CHEQI
MAANFWTSTHYQQLMHPEDVDVVQQLDRDRGITLDDFKLVKMHISNYITKMAQLVKVRQRVVATAITYMRRVYTRKSLTEFDPRLVALTSLYLAAKAEENPEDIRYRFDIKDILEMEMKILEALNYYLVVFHPYRSLTQFLQDAGMMDLMQFTWGIVNDTYKMDLILIHPPHLIALACIYIASVSKDKDSVAWFEELRVDMNVVKNISMEILDFYDSMKNNIEERVNVIFGKLPSRS